MENIWKTYSERVCKYLNKRIDNEALACDLMQDTFYKVLTNQHKLNNISNYEAWIFRIARNTLIDYTRKKKEKTIGNLLLLDNREDISEETSEIVEISECLYELIEKYNPEERELLLDVLTKSVTQKEASQYLGIPYSTLKSRVQKARNKILKEFKTRCRLKYNQQGQIIGCTPV